MVLVSCARRHNLGMILRFVLVVFAAIIAIQAYGQTFDPRRKWELPNGAIILVEQFPKAKDISVQLWAASRGAEDTPETYGRRHLLEHFVARGDGTLDAQLESNGLFLTAETFRDATQYEIRGEPGQWKLALEVVGKLLKPIAPTAQSIAHEAQIMAHELASQADHRWLTMGTWSAGYGDSGMDTLGDLAAIRATSPEQLIELQKAHFRPRNLVLVIAGPIDQDQVGVVARGLLQSLPEQPAATYRERSEYQAKSQTVDRVYGQALGAGVPSLSDSKMIHGLAAVLGVASRNRGTSVSFMLSYRPSVISLVTTRTDLDLVEIVNQMSSSEIAMCFSPGKNIAENWIRGNLSQPSSSAFLRGLLLSQNPLGRPEILLDFLRTMTIEDFRAGFARLKSDKASLAIGGLK